MARYPYHGEVKTRLAERLDAQARATLYAAFLADTLRQLARLRAVSRAIVYTPADEAAWFRTLAGPEMRLIPQREGSLGPRVVGAFEDLFGVADCVMLTGSDSPNLPAAYLEQGARALEQGEDVVLGPADDGGYYCIGLTRPAPHLFDQVEWSTARTFEQTAAAAQAHGLRVHRLPTWYDVDWPQDLDRLERDLQAGHGAPAPRTLAALRALAEQQPSS